MAKKNELPELPKSFGSKEEKAAFVEAVRVEFEKRSAKVEKILKDHQVACNLQHLTAAHLEKAKAIRVKAVKA